jgi:DNA modification methylase
MQIEQRPIASIEPYGKNAKKHPEKQVEQIANSIREFGFNQPIVVDANNVIIVGHGRYLAAHLLGMAMVPVLQMEIDEEKAKAYRLADNKLNESEWDMQLVIAELKELSLTSVDLTGFDRRLVLNNNDRDDDVPAVPKVARTQPGDVYELGDHRIMCGDSTLEATYLSLMATKRADMVFTDPPYNVDYKGSGKNTSEGIMNDKMEDASFRVFLTAAFAQLHQFTKEGGGWYVFHSSTTQKIFEEALNANMMDVITQLIWNKPSAGLGGNAYRSKHEPFFYAGVKGITPQFYGDRTHSSVLDLTKTEEQLMKWVKKQKAAELEGRTTIWNMKRAPVQEYVHPTQKPVELVMYAIHNSSKVGDIVLDPFLGSGTTLIACEKTNRACYGLELDPKYVDVIVERWCTFTENHTIKKNGEVVTW